MDLFITNIQLFSSQDVNWWIGVVWITCGLLWCFISCLDSHSDGTHPLQWTHWWASDVMLHFSKQVPMKKQTHLHLGWPEREYIFSKLAFLGEIPLITCPYYGLWKFNILVLGSWHACKVKKPFYCLIIYFFFYLAQRLPNDSLNYNIFPNPSFVWR